MKDREVQCKFYLNEKNCLKGREGTFKKKCQTCDKYIPLPGGKPARTDNRRQKMDRIRRKEDRF
jgi:hypothetical protein